MKLRINVENLKSNEELYFAWYMEELWDAGFINGYEEHAKTFELSDPVSYNVVDKLLKTKIKNKDQTLLRENTYTEDFIIYWNKNAEGIFYEEVYTNKSVYDKTTPFLIWSNTPSALISYIDVKSSVPTRFAKNVSSVYTFPIEQKWVMDKYDAYIQKVVPVGKNNCLFATTFTPKRYLFTDVVMSKRTIHHKIENLYNYAENKLKNYGKIKNRCNPKGLFLSE